MNKELPKVYEPQQVESRIYQMWEDHDCFKGVEDSKKKSFSIVMPPPNVTGQLHMGHALDCTLQDILTRFKRMQGYAALWVPGTDHAGIATQIKVEEELRVKEGKTQVIAGLEVEGGIRQPHRPAAEEDGRFLRLEPRPLHHGRGLLQGRPGDLLRAVRQGSHLQGQPHHQLVPPLRHRVV